MAIETEPNTGKPLLSLRARKELHGLATEKDSDWPSVDVLLHGMGDMMLPFVNEKKLSDTTLQDIAELRHAHTLWYAQFKKTPAGKKQRRKTVIVSIAALGGTLLLMWIGSLLFT